jgi:hypothetical protein
MDVTSGVVNVTQNESEDTNRPFAPVAVGKLYAGLTFSFSALPSGAGTYFFHFLSTPTIFRGKVFATTTGAAPGALRIGISNNANTPSVVLPTDISLNTSHRLVFSLDVVTATAALFLDSPVEIGGVTATDGTPAVAITAVALRQSLATGNGMGTLTGDNLNVATTYSEAYGAATAVPEASAFLFVGLAAAAVLGRKLFKRQAAQQPVEDVA